MNKELFDLRKEIDDINFALLELLNKRTELVKEVARKKDESSAEYFDIERQEQILEAVLKKNQGPLPSALVKDIFHSILGASLTFMGISSERELLVQMESTKAFSNIRDLFSLGEDEPVIIAGPCSIEKEEYLESVAMLLKKKGLHFIRGGAYKPRTSPYEFQGLRKEGLEILKNVSGRYGLYGITEVVDTRDVELISQYADVIQIGARNMQNFELLKEVGKTKQPILLKRGISATIDELILAAEYIALNGNQNVILCERGIRTFETKTRNTLDLSAVPIIKQETVLPVIVDLSHSLGRKDIIESVACAALAVGADGIMVEVHPVPELALSDSKQQLNLNEFRKMLNTLKSKKWI